jgi:hypothetical protein
MRRALTAGIGGAAAIGLLLSAAPLRGQSIDLPGLMTRVGESVTRYYARAQSIICTETVRIQSLGWDLVPDGTPARRLEYELRVAWDPAQDGETPDASVLRELVKVNGRPPRPKDEPGCMDPKAVSPEPLAMLLPAAQADYVFTVAGRGRVNKRPAVMIDYRSRATGPMEVTSRKECLSIELPGRTRGRIWVDVETADVLRIDERLTGMFDVPLPKEQRTAGLANWITIERADSSILYRPIAFSDPEEVVMLPVSINSVTVIRNSGMPRRRTVQEFSNYRRFITGGRIVQ